MGETQELQNLRLRIMAEVNEKVKEINDQFDEIISGLDKDGTEFARSLKAEIVGMKKGVKKEMENVWSYLKSKLVSIEAGQKMLYDPGEGIMSKTLEKAEMAVKMARDSAACTAACLKAVEGTQDHIDKQDEKHKEEVGVYKSFVKDSRLYMLIFIVSIATASLAGIGLGVAKLIQDHNNQVQTVSYLKSLDSGVKVEGVVDMVNGLSPEKRKALLSQIKKK
jgi:hypothetical protein